MRAELRGVGRKDGSSEGKAIDAQYDTRPWMPLNIEISVKVDGDKAQVAVSTSTEHKLSWSGDISSIENDSAERMPFTVRFNTAGLAVRSAKLTPRGSAVTYAYDENVPTVPAGRK